MVLFPSHPLTYQKLLFILISLVLFVISWLFSSFIKTPDTKGSVSIWSLMHFACLLMFISTYCHPSGEEDLQGIKGQNSFFKSSLRYVICVLRHTPFFTSAEIAWFFSSTIPTKIRVSLFSCSLVMSRLRALGRGHLEATYRKGISGYKLLLLWLLLSISRLKWSYIIALLYGQQTCVTVTLEHNGSE